MASRIKGITVEIGGDTTGLQNALKQVNSSTDSRGRTSAAKTVSISVVSYSVPSFSSYLSQRCSSSGTLADDGTYIKASVSYSYSSCSSKNSVTRATYYRKIGVAAWTNASKSFSSGIAFTFSSGNISTESTYEIKYSLTDAFTTISVIDTVSTAAVIMDFKSGGTGIAVGKVSERNHCFEVASDWSVRLRCARSSGQAVFCVQQLSFSTFPTRDCLWWKMQPISVCPYRRKSNQY